MSTLHYTSSVPYRMDYISTEDDDKLAEEKTITKALSQFSYPQWTIDKVKKDRRSKAENPKKKTRSLTAVTLPYIKGATEHV